jgi:heme/copper-type cytochrome/quinol oxidase subunit 2
MPASPPRWPWVALALAALAIALVPAEALSLAAGFYGDAESGNAGPKGAAERVFRIEASSFAYSPPELYVNPGDTVTLELVATDYVHGLHVDGYDLALTAEPGHTGRLTFVADRPGAFRFRCSVTCGPLHPFMIGKLNVGPNWGLARAVGLAGLAVLAGLLLAPRGHS